MKKLFTVPKRLGIAAVAVTGLAIGGTAAAVTISPSSSTEDVAPFTIEPTVPTSAAPSTSEAPPVMTPEPAPPPDQPAQQPAGQPAEAPPAATVAEAPQPAAPDQGGIVDPESIGSFDENGVYQPAPPIARPGDPPVAPQPPPPPVDVQPELPPLK